MTEVASFRFPTKRSYNRLQEFFSLASICRLKTALPLCEQLVTSSMASVREGVNHYCLKL